MGGKTCTNCNEVFSFYLTCKKCDNPWACPKCGFCNYCGHQDKHLHYIKRILQRKRDSKKEKIEELSKGNYINLYELASLEKQIELLENIHEEFLHY